MGSEADLHCEQNRKYGIKQDYQYSVSAMVIEQRENIRIIRVQNKRKCFLEERTSYVRLGFAYMYPLISYKLKKVVLLSPLGLCHIALMHLF